MGEYAEIAWQQEMARGFRHKPREVNGRNPIVRHCPVCGKGTRAVGWDEEAGLKAHMKSKHNPQAGAKQ